MKSHLVLASGSPRRAALLRRLSLEFTVRPPLGLDEPTDAGDPVGGTLAAARAKADRILLEPGELLLAADTVIALPDGLLGKPADPTEARRMLARLSGRWHRVLTGVVVRRHGGADRLGVAETRVRFRRLDPKEIAAYVASGEPMDKAGAYGIQGAGAALVAMIQGCPSNVIGLPLELTISLLRAAGLSILGLPQ